MWENHCIFIWKSVKSKINCSVQEYYAYQLFYTAIPTFCTCSWLFAPAIDFLVPRNGVPTKIKDAGGIEKCLTDIEIILIDVTETPIQRPKKKAT